MRRLRVLYLLALIKAVRDKNFRIREGRLAKATVKTLIVAGFVGNQYKIIPFNDWQLLIRIFRRDFINIFLLFFQFRRN
jgi:hypothetical protein